MLLKTYYGFQYLVQRLRILIKIVFIMHIIKCRRIEKLYCSLFRRRYALDISTAEVNKVFKS